MHYLLIYKTAPDYVTRRGQFRAAHLDHAWNASERGELLMGGAIGEPIDGAMLLFSCDSPLVPEAFAKGDPYVLSGVVLSWQVKPWHTVAGPLASNPIRKV